MQSLPSTEPLEGSSSKTWPDHNELLDASEDGLFEFVSAFFRRSLQQLFHVHSSPELRLDVNEWIFGPALLSPWEEPLPLSFQHCCRVLGVDALAMREFIHGYLVQTEIVDLMDRGDMAVRSKVRASSDPVDISTDDLPTWVQLMIFSEDDADFVPPPIPKRRRQRSTEPTPQAADFGEQISLFDSAVSYCA